MMIQDDGCDEKLLGKANETQTAVKYLSKDNGKNSTRGERCHKQRQISCCKTEGRLQSAIGLFIYSLLPVIVSIHRAVEYYCVVLFTNGF